MALLASAATATAAAALPTTASALTLAVTTKSPKDVAATTATMRAQATVPVLGAEVSWQYGTTTGYGTQTATVPTSLIGVSETLTLPTTGLAPGTTYHVRAVATSGLTTSYGRDVTFTTDADASGSGDSDTSDTSNTSSGSSGSGSSGSSPASSGSSNASNAASGSNGATASDGAGANASPVAAAVAKGLDPAAAVPPGTATADVTPVLGRTVAVAAVQGTVTATDPSGAPVDLGDARAVPTGTVIDARAGTVELTAALDRAGAAKQTGRFWGGRFEIRQDAGAHGLTRLVLRGGDFSACAGRVARAATDPTRKKPPVRRLWGSDDHGRFQTKGRGSVATVRGTRWMTRDTCAGTLTRVTAGAVDVRDLRTGRTVTVRHGHEHLARASR